MKLLSLVSVALFLAPAAHAYYGRNSTEAVLKYKTVVDVPWTGKVTVDDLEGRRLQHALDLVDTQVQHLMGTFQSESFLNEFGYAGVLGDDYDVVFTKIEPGSAPGRKQIHYQFTGRVVFEKGAFRSGAARKVPLKLPLAPDQVYALGLKGDVNHCTDHHYNTEGDFWYFWDPEMEGCPLQGDTVNVLHVEGELQPKPNTEWTYPDYDKLYGNNGNGKNFEISVFFGFANEIENPNKPNRRDEARGGFNQIEKELKTRGFFPLEKKDNFRLYSDGREYHGINHFRMYVKDDVVVRVLLTDTDIASRDGTFHYYLQEAMAHSDVVVYDGHSGLGGNLALDRLPGIKFDPKKYQIFFFNGCSSYPYFNSQFFEAKGSGKKNLEIITSGLPTYFDTAGPNLIAFLDGFLEQKKWSYQTILQGLERSNGDYGTYLVGVSGDEDNQWKP